MDYATWEKYKGELANETWTAWGKWPADVQDAMREVELAYRQYLSSDGVWCIANTNNFLIGTINRVTPSWTGPAKPEPVAEYEDCKVELSGDGSVYIYRFGSVNCSKRPIDQAIANPLFAGYFMPDGKLRPRLLFDDQPDGTYRLRVPKAVRMRKEGGR